MERFTVSVIIPVYNMAVYLRECLDSIIRQELEHVEIVAVNDGSTDDSLKILYQYQKLYSHLVIFTQDNQGTGIARNVGLKNARGKYVAFMDPDDYYPNNYCLMELYNAAEVHCAQICGGVLIENRGGVCRRKYQIETNSELDNSFVKTSEYNEIYGFTRYIFRTDFLQSRRIRFSPYRRYEEEAFTVKALAEAGEFLAISADVYEARVGYKRQKYPLEMSIDILSGIRDVYRVVEEYDLYKMYEKGLKNISDEYILPFYRYSYMGYKEIDDVLEEINEITLRWRNDQRHLITQNHVQQFREECVNEYEDIQRLIEEKKVLIYGAGLNTKVFFDVLVREYSNVIGIAVTQKTRLQPSKMNNLEVRLIEEYVSWQEQAVVLVTAAPRYWHEIEETLDSLQFKYVRYVDVRKMELAESLLCDGKDAKRGKL